MPAAGAGAAVAAAGEPGCIQASGLSASAASAAASVLVAGPVADDGEALVLVSAWVSGAQFPRLLLLLALAGSLMAGGACAALAAAPASAAASSACSAAPSVVAGAADTWSDGAGAVAARPEAPCLLWSVLLEAGAAAASAEVAASALAAGAAGAALAGDATGDRSPAALAAAMVAGLLVLCAEAALLLALCCWPLDCVPGRVMLVPLPSPACEAGSVMLLIAQLAGESAAPLPGPGLWPAGM
jgi:hypothetical protein